MLLVNSLLAFAFAAISVLIANTSMSFISPQGALSLGGTVGLMAAVPYAIWQERDAQRRYDDRRTEQLRPNGPLGDLRRQSNGTGQ